jgi:hypothetical protein
MDALDAKSLLVELALAVFEHTRLAQAAARNLEDAQSLSDSFVAYRVMHSLALKALAKVFRSAQTGKDQPGPDGESIDYGNQDPE